MTAPFYVSPEQWFQDKAEYARKGIARGRPIVAVEYSDGIVLMAENRSGTLRKISEIFDRIAFGGVGKLDEYESLRKAGVRYADLRGFSYCREDVAARNLANEFSTLLGSIFTREMKAFEVEILLAEVGEERGEGSLYRIMYDGSIQDHRQFAAIGGNSDELLEFVRKGWREEMSLEQGVRLGRDALSQVGNGSSDLDESSLEVAVLERERTGRKFRRLVREEVQKLVRG
jgi:proteasome alpha subunit